MRLKLVRHTTGKDSTGGLLFINDSFAFYTCEDQYQENKVLKETRIPEGIYQIKLRNAGGMNERYKVKFNFHQGMLHLQDVPDFEWVYIHVGNNDDDTEGCILVGRSITTVNGESAVGDSVLAYTQLYNMILLAMKEKNEDVWIEVTA